MFFRREKPQQITYGDRVRTLQQAGFEILAQPGGKTRVVKGGYAAEIADGGTHAPSFGNPGVLLGDEIGTLTDLGYQKVFETPTQKRLPAQASQLKALHAFQEDLREALGLTSLYNESLGTINESHVYDRVADRDHGVPHRPWER
ncbi:MAG: hypothetical protein JJE04_25550 [Acidobacteriia bacterium]|nr:hypothetical protein [Terriglobia bacterium]